MKRLLVIATLIVAALVAGVALLFAYLSGYTTWASLDAGHNRRAFIYVERFNIEGYHHCVYSEFRQRGAVVASRISIGTDRYLHPPFILVPTPDPDIVAVAMADQPTEIVAIYDYALGERWPGSYGWPQCINVADGLLAQVRRTNPAYRLHHWGSVEPAASATE